MAAPTSVLDASALLAYLHDEPGAAQAADALIDGAWISAVNWAEALSKLAELGQDPEEVATRLAAEGLMDVALHVHPLDESLAREVARLRPLTKDRGLSLGDRACLALAKHLGLPALTADRAWSGLDLGVTVQVVR